MSSQRAIVLIPRDGLCSVWMRKLMGKDSDKIPLATLMRTFLRYYYDKTWRVSHLRTSSCKDAKGAVFAGDHVWLAYARAQMMTAKDLGAQQQQERKRSPLVSELPRLVQYFHFSIASSRPLEWNFACRMQWNAEKFQALTEDFLAAFEDGTLPADSMHMWGRLAYESCWALALAPKTTSIASVIPEDARGLSQDALLDMIDEGLRFDIGTDGRTEFRRFLIAMCLPAGGYQEFESILTMKPSEEHMQDMFRETMVMSGMDNQTMVNILDFLYECVGMGIPALIEPTDPRGVRQHAILFAFSRILSAYGNIDFIREFFFFPHQVCNYAFLEKTKRERASKTLAILETPFVALFGGHVFLFFRGRVYDCGLSFEYAIIGWLYLMHDHCGKKTIDGRSIAAFYKHFFHRLMQRSRRQERESANVRSSGDGVEHMDRSGTPDTTEESMDDLFNDRGMPDARPDPADLPGSPPPSHDAAPAAAASFGDTRAGTFPAFQWFLDDGVESKFCFMKKWKPQGGDTAIQTHYNNLERLFYKGFGSDDNKTAALAVKSYYDEHVRDAVEGTPEMTIDTIMRFYVEYGSTQAKNTFNMQTVDQVLLLLTKTMVRLDNTTGQPVDLDMKKAKTYETFAKLRMSMLKH